MTSSLRVRPDTMVRAARLLLEIPESAWLTPHLSKAKNLCSQLQETLHHPINMPLATKTQQVAELEKIHKSCYVSLKRSWNILRKKRLMGYPRCYKGQNNEQSH